MFSRIAQYIGGRILTAMLVCGAGLTGLWFYRHPEQIEPLWRTVRAGLLWIGFVVLLPWSLFFVPRWLVKAASNLPAVGVLVGYLGLDLLMALYLAGWNVDGTLLWALLTLGCLMAGLYNFVVCDFLAERFDDTV